MAEDTVTSLALGFVTKAAGGKFELPGLPSLTRAFGSTVFDEVVVDSQFSPEYSLQPWAPGDGQPDTPRSPLPGMVGRYIRPRVRVRKNGQTVVTFAPFGEPSGAWLPNAVGLTSGVVALTAFALGAKKTGMAALFVSAAGFGLGYMTRPKS